MQTTSIQTLKDKFSSDNFIFTITEETVNNYNNPEITISLQNDNNPLSIVKINRPNNKAWKAIQPKIAVTYSASIIYNEKHERYSFSPIEVYTPEQFSDDYTTTVTTYSDLPYKAGVPFIVACVVLDTTVSNPSMYLKGDHGLHRVIVPKTFKDVDSINGRYVTMVLKRGLKKTRLRIVEVSAPIGATMIEDITKSKIEATTVDKTSHDLAQSVVINEPTQTDPYSLITIGSEWESESSIVGSSVVTVQHIDELKSDKLVWVNDSYILASEFLAIYKLVEQDLWLAGVPKHGALARHKNNKAIVLIVTDKSDLAQYIPLTKEEVLEYVYCQNGYFDEDEIPF